MKKMLKFRPCPACQGNLTRKNYNAQLERCAGGCGKLICRRCAVNHRCLECYLAENAAGLERYYNQDKYKQVVT